jgi:hypothetical protein
MNTPPLGITSKERQGGERSPVKPIVRRVLVGLLCGMASSMFLCSAVRSVGLGLFLGSLLGVAQVFAFFELESGSAIDRAMTCAALGLPFWATINLILLPMAAGQVPQWTAGDMRSLFPALIGWLLFFLNAVTMRTIKGKQLCSCRDFRIFNRAALRGRFTGGYGSVGLNDARRSQERADNRSGDQQSADQSLYFDIHCEDTEANGSKPFRLPRNPRC